MTALLRTPYAEREPVQQRQRSGRYPKGVTNMHPYRYRQFRPGVLAEICRHDIAQNIGRRVRVIQASCSDWCVVHSLGKPLYRVTDMGTVADSSALLPTECLRRVWTGGCRPNAGRPL